MNSISKRSYNLESINWPNLPGTETEGKKIASLINAKLFMGNQATSEKIKNLKNFKILHIASHSYYLNDQCAIVNDQCSIKLQDFFRSDSL